MIGIRAIASYVPNQSIDNLAQAEKFGESSSFAEEKIGAVRLPILGHGQETSDIAVLAVENLLGRENLSRDSIDALIVVTQNPDGFGLPHTAAIVQEKLELRKSIASFDLSLGCSGYVYGLSVIRGLMEQAGLQNGILITADPYSKVIDREDRVTSLLFGDAATATWLGESPIWDLGTPILQTDGSGRDSLRINENRKLEMDGRKVFNFAAQRVPDQINLWLLKNNMTPRDVDQFCLHQGSGAIIDAIARKFPGQSDRFVKDLELTGNTVSSSIPLLLEKHILASKAQTVILSGFGVGLSWATNLIRRITDD